MSGDTLPCDTLFCDTLSGDTLSGVALYEVTPTAGKYRDLYCLVIHCLYYIFNIPGQSRLVNRAGVAWAVLQAPLSLINQLIN